MSVQLLPLKVFEDLDLQRQELLTSALIYITFVILVITVNQPTRVSALSSAPLDYGYKFVICEF